MLKKIFLPLIMVIILPNFASAKKMGAGLLLMGPAAVSFENYLDTNRSFDAALGWDFRRGGQIYMHSTYLLHRKEQSTDPNFNFGWYYGGGGFLALGKAENNLGGRAVIGIDYDHQIAPFLVFAELAAHLNLVPNTFTDLQIGIGGRYYF